MLQYSYGTNLCREVYIFLFVLGTQVVPPFPEYLADCPVILVWVLLMDKCSMSLAKDHESIHGTANVFFILP